MGWEGPILRMGLRAIVASDYGGGVGKSGEWREGGKWRVTLTAVNWASVDLL